MLQKVQMYILSLWLLFVLVAIKAFDFYNWDYSDSWHTNLLEFAKLNLVSLSSLLMLIMGVVFYWRFKYVLKGSTKLPKKITKIENQNYEHLTFLTTYIIPFLRVNLEGRDLLITILLLVIIGAIFVKTQLFYKNPTLALLGYHLYKVDTENSKGIIFISRDFLKEGDSVHHIQLDYNIYFVKL